MSCNLIQYKIDSLWIACNLILYKMDSLRMACNLMCFYFVQIEVEGDVI